MLDQLIMLVEQHSQKTIVQNAAIPDQHNKAAVSEVANQIFTGLQGQVKQGNLQQVVSMFQGKPSANALSNNPLVNSLVKNVAGSLASKFGVSQQQAESIANSLLPQVMNQFVQKTNNPNDRDFDFQDMMRGFTGNTNFNTGSILGQLKDNSKTKESVDAAGDILGKFFGK